MLGVELDPLGERGRQPARGVPAARHRHPRPVLRPHQGPRQHVLRPRPRRARRLRAPVLPARSPGSPAVPRRRSARRVHGAAPTSAWKGRSSRRWPSRSCIAPWGMDIIGMTNLQEAKLAREAEICYATIALVTDYDCWHPDHDSVTVEMIIAQPDAEREDGAADHRRRRDPAAGRADVRVRDRARDRHHHAARRDSGCDAGRSSRRSSAST